MIHNLDAFCNYGRIGSTPYEVILQQKIKHEYLEDFKFSITLHIAETLKIVRLHMNATYSILAKNEGVNKPSFLLQFIEMRFGIFQVGGT